MDLLGQLPVVIPLIRSQVKNTHLEIAPCTDLEFVVIPLIRSQVKNLERGKLKGNGGISRNPFNQVTSKKFVTWPKGLAP